MSAPILPRRKMSERYPVYNGKYLKLLHTCVYNLLSSRRRPLSVWESASFLRSSLALEICRRTNVSSWSQKVNIQKELSLACWLLDKAVHNIVLKMKSVHVGIRKLEVRPITTFLRPTNLYERFLDICSRISSILARILKPNIHTLW